jgi:hypothetical protein
LGYSWAQKPFVIPEPDHRFTPFDYFAGSHQVQVASGENLRPIDTCNSHTEEHFLFSRFFDHGGPDHALCR